MTLRLQKIIANAGLASRREAERLIDEGLVTINGKVVRQQGVQADPGTDRIKVNGKDSPCGKEGIHSAQQAPGFFDHGERR